MTGLLIILSICAALFIVSTSINSGDDLFTILALIVLGIAIGWILGG